MNSRSVTGSFRSCWFFDMNKGWVVGDSGIILVTTNGGASWNRNTALSPYKSLRSIRFTDDAHGWIVGDSGMIYATTNGGSSWARHASPVTTNLRAIAMIDNQTGWIVGQAGTVLRTTGGGSQWDVVDLGSIRDFFSVVFVNPDTGFISGNSTIITRTTDGGNNWFSAPSNSSFPVFALHVVHNNLIYGIGYSTFVHSAQDGSLWFTNPVSTGSVYYDLSFIDSASGWVGGFGGDLARTQNGGQTWTHLLRGISDDFNSFAIVDSSTIVCVGNQGVMVQSKDGGATFANVQPPGLSTAMKSVRFATRLTGWAVGAGGTIVQTQDGGATWVPQSSGTLNSLQCLSMIDNNVGWAGGQTILLQTHNGGITWVSKNLPDTSAVINDMYFSSQNTGVVLAANINGFNTRILYTSDEGTTWSGADKSITGSASAIYFLDSLDGWAVGNGNTMLVTQDGGRTWLPAILPLNHFYTNVFFADDNRGWVASNTGTILRTLDGGITWYLLPSNTTNSISRIGFYDADTGWVVGSSGMILKTTDAGGTGTLLHGSLPPLIQRRGLTVLSNFPNPFTDSTWIPFDLLTKTPVTVKIFDLKGHLMQEYDLGVLRSGKYRDVSRAVYWNGKDQNNYRAASGVYFYQITTSYNTLVGKMILVR